VITPRDLLTPAGEPATLEVELERRLCAFVDPAIEGQEVEVVGVGRARTDADGVAAFSLGAVPSGLRRYEVRARGASVEALVCAIPREAPIFITDIDHTIADVSSMGFIFKPLHRVRPLPGAVEALCEIARSLQVVYLTARDHIFTAKTKEWLLLNGFPEGPVYLRKGSRFWSLSPGKHKLARLQELHRFTEIHWGVGDTTEDVAAYAAHSIRPILFAAHPPASLPPDVLCLADWAGILQAVKRWTPIPRQAGIDP
jgi:hypothetical protein